MNLSQDSISARSRARDAIKDNLQTEDRLLFDADIEAGLDAVEIMERGLWPDHAQTMHAKVAQVLQCAGFRVKFEFPTKYLGYRGRIDLAATKAGGKVFIELDCRSPKDKSIRKLLLVDGFRIVGLRGESQCGIPNGIDALVKLPIRMAYRGEKSDRRTVKRFA